MFRGGGKVSSYGNGIASGLGYAGGGQIGGGAVYGQLMPDGRYGFQNPFIPIGQTKSQIDAARQAINQMYGIADDFADVGSKSNVKTQGGNILKRNINKIKNIKLPAGANLEARIGSGIKSLYNLLPEEGLLSKGGRFATKVAGQFPKLTKGSGILAAVSGPGMIAEANRPKTYAALQYMKDMNQSGVFDETAIPTMDGELGEYDKFTLEFDKLNDPSKYTAIPDDRGFFNKYLNPMGAIVGLGDKSKEEIGLIVDEDNKKIDEAETKAAAETGKETTVDINTGNVVEPVLSKKERLEQKAKEYEEILGAGIKKDSIFDAMIEGGTRLYEGEGAGSAIRAANKALDPIQNIKTASRKLAVEEDIAIRKALAVAKGKSNATRDLIEQYKKAGLNDREIANRLSNNEVELEVIVQKMGSKPEGYKEFVRKKYPGVNILQETDPKKIDTSLLDDGRHYITYPTDAFIEVKDGKLVGKIDYR
tara:strand:+ start:156 stop:1589 length:1434 start_codon:yes stop_codon:yes gene_type:complete